MQGVIKQHMVFQIQHAIALKFGYVKHCPICAFYAVVRYGVAREKELSCTHIVERFASKQIF